MKKNRIIAVKYSCQCGNTFEDKVPAKSKIVRVKSYNALCVYCGFALLREMVWKYKRD